MLLLICIIALNSVSDASLLLRRTPQKSVDSSSDDPDSNHDCVPGCHGKCGYNWYQDNFHHGHPSLGYTNYFFGLTCECCDTDSEEMFNICKVACVSTTPEPTAAPTKAPSIASPTDEPTTSKPTNPPPKGTKTITVKCAKENEKAVDCSSKKGKFVCCDGLVCHKKLKWLCVKKENQKCAPKGYRAKHCGAAHNPVASIACCEGLECGGKDGKQCV